MSSDKIDLAALASSYASLQLCQCPIETCQIDLVSSFQLKTLHSIQFDEFYVRKFPYSNPNLKYSTLQALSRVELKMISSSAFPAVVGRACGDSSTAL